MLKNFYSKIYLKKTLSYLSKYIPTFTNKHPLTKLKRSTHIDRAHKDPKTNGFIVAKPMTPAEIMGEKKGTYLFHRGERDTLLCLVADCILIPGHMELPDDGDGSFHFRRNPRPSTINVLLGAGIVSPYSEMASFVEDRTDTRRPNTGRPNLTDYDRFIGVLRQGGLGKLFGIDQSGFRNANS
ncbi:hypothetical protein HYT84_04520 [Candidatus Micrarchaeota archaeon]|nr:hypothetical protein [Candidatus Micrarchaeota archaeon]